MFVQIAHCTKAPGGGRGVGTGHWDPELSPYLITEPCNLVRAVSAQRKGSSLQIHLLSMSPSTGAPLFLLRHKEGQAAALGELGGCLWRKGSCVEPQPRILWFLWATITSLLPQVETPLEVHTVLAGEPDLFWYLWSPSGHWWGTMPVHL